jgi:hypothetical protein
MREFTRVAWASQGARETWEPRIRAISAALLDVEVASVRAGIRPAALQFTPDTAALRRFGDLPFAPVAPGRCVVAQSQAEVDGFVKDWHQGSRDVAIGARLGFPTCCNGFFNRVWNRDGKRDTTLSMAGDPNGPVNILGRWLGVRSVFHLPCAWTCEETAALAAALDRLWPADVRQWRDEILSWPVRYSALHGVAIVTFPVVRVVAETDYTAVEVALQRIGTRYPAEAPRGLTFPFQRAASAPLRVVRKAAAAPPAENGFPTLAAQDAAHRMVLEALGGLTATSALDLGCGNGALLRKIGAARSVGVEILPDRVAACRALGGVDVHHGAIEDVAGLVYSSVPDFKFDVVLIAKRRFNEMTAAGERRVRAWLAEHATHVLTYSYDDPMFATLEAVTCYPA